MVKIYVMTHRQFQKPEDPVYIPMHVGKAAAKETLPYLGDDTGDHISALNCYYGELTGLYWIWKQETEADIVGICHYRRYFVNESGQFLNREEYEEALSDCDVMVSNMISGKSNWENYAQAHNAADMQAVADAIQKLYPHDYAAFCSVMEDTKSCYSNLMVTSLEKYQEYCTWLFSILQEAGNSIQPDGYDQYQKRVYGFLSEVLLYVWATARGYRIKECRIGVTGEKAETTELKKAIGNLIQEGNITQAKKVFYETLDLRPDLRLELSDIKGDLAVIEKLLYIMHEEQKTQEYGLLQFHNDLSVLMEHYKNTYQMIAKNGSRAREAGKVYFDAFAVSDTAFRIIEQDISGKISLYEYLNENETPKKVSVIVLLHDKTDTFSFGIGNLMNQTLEDTAIVFVDLCGQEESSKLLQECVQRYPKKVRVVSPDAGNAYMPVIDSEYILVMRAEDLLDCAACEKLYQAAKESGWKLTGGNYIDSQRQSVSPVFAEKKAIGQASGEKKYCFTDEQMHWGFLIHRDVWEHKMEDAAMPDHFAQMENVLRHVLDDQDQAGCVDDIIYKYIG